METIALTALGAVAGAALGSLLACLPGFHIYSLLAFAVMGLNALAAQGVGVAPELVVSVFAGLVVGYAMLNTVPSVVFAAPDESALFTVLPGQKCLMQGTGRDAIRITAVGALGALFVLVCIVGPLAGRLLPIVRNVFRPHMHWVVWCIIVFMLMSEWPKRTPPGQAGWGRLAGAWRSLGAGLLTFGLSGVLGFVLLHRPPLRAAVAFQNLMPAFVGLFGLPWLLLNIVSHVDVPEQDDEGRMALPWIDAVKGTLAGTLGGGFAAFFPAVTGGIGGFLAGHAAALRDDRTFLVSQGASKMAYYAGAFLFFFVPGLGLTRGGAAWMLRTVHAPEATRDGWLALGAIAIAGMVSFLLVGRMTEAALHMIRRYGYRQISLLALGLVLVLVALLTGVAGLLVAAVAAAIGLIPVLYGSRRINCLGVILLPIACGLSEFKAAEWLGLL